MVTTMSGDEKGSKDNSVDISGEISNSTISVNQNQDGNQSIRDSQIEYQVDANSYREVSGETYKKSRNVFYTSVVVLALGVLADIGDLFALLGFDRGVVAFVSVGLFFVIKEMTQYGCWVNNLTYDEESHYRNGQWYEKLSNNNVAIYYKRGKCIYPKCEGSIDIVPAPPRERHNHDVIGKCSLGGIQHTYTMDFNGVGYPQKFDWRPVPQENKQA